MIEADAMEKTRQASINMITMAMVDSDRLKAAETELIMFKLIMFKTLEAVVDFASEMGMPPSELITHRMSELKMELEPLGLLK